MSGPPPPPNSKYPYPPPGSTMPSEYAYPPKPSAHPFGDSSTYSPYPPASSAPGMPQSSQPGGFYPAPTGTDAKQNYPPHYPPGGNLGPAPLRDENRFSPPKGFQDLWAALLFILHLAGVAVIAGLTIPHLDLNKLGADSNQNNSTNNNNNNNNINNSSSDIKFFTRDIVALVVGSVFSVLFSIMLLFAMRAFPRGLIVLSFWGCFLLYAAMGIFYIILRQYIAGIVVFAVSLITILLWFVYRKRIPFTAVMLRIVTGVTIQYPGTIWCGFFVLIVGIAYLVLWVVTLLSAYSKYTLNGSNENTMRAILTAITVFMLFSLYWTTQVIKNVTHVSVSGVFAAYYFLKGTPEGMPSFPTVRSFKRAVTTSFGSICFGSLLIALVQLVRALLREVMSNSNNGLLVFLICCIECLLSWIESLANLFNVYAFTQVAIYGKPFCRAAKDTWTLIQDRGLELVINNSLIGTVVGFLSLFLGSITALVAFIVWFVQDTSVNLAANQTQLLFIIIISVVIGLVFFSIIGEVVESGAATTFVALAEDPAALKASKPELWEQIRQTYPEAAFTNMYS